MPRANIVDDLVPLAVPPADLELLPGNPRRGEVAAVKASYVHFGQRKPIVARRSDRTVIAGNHQLMAVRELGWDAIAVVWVEDDDATAEAFALTDNRTGELGTYNRPDLSAMMTRVAEAGLLEVTGWAREDLAELMTSLRPPPTTDPDELPAAPKQVISAPGDLWELGPHRLGVGDSTVGADVARLLGDEVPVLLVTDPPYGVSLDASWRTKAGLQRRGQTDRLEGDDRVDWGEAYALSGADVAFVWHAGLLGPAVAESLERVGYELRSQIVWVKPVFVIGRGHYHGKHESCWHAVKPGGRHDDAAYCWYAVRDGASGHWTGDRTQSTVWEAPAPRQIASGSAEHREDHPTQKPVSLFQRPIRNHSRGGELIYDAFAGSGTALIAAHMEGRRAAVMEKSPTYADLICRRWQRFTGEKPVRSGEVVAFE